jgi:general secretion pathway protein M
VNWLRSHLRSASICALTLLIPLFLYLNALLGLWGVRLASQAEIDYSKPRIARLRGLIGHESALRDSSALARQELEERVYPASSDRATVSATLQSSVRQILSDAGLSVSNSQVLPAREDENFDQIVIRLTATGDIAGLNTALTAIAEYKPLLVVESLEVRPEEGRRGDAKSQTVFATMQLLSLRAML